MFVFWLVVIMVCCWCVVFCVEYFCVVLFDGGKWVGVFGDSLCIFFFVLYDF